MLASVYPVVTNGRADLIFRNFLSAMVVVIMAVIDAGNGGGVVDSHGGGNDSADERKSL